MHPNKIYSPCRRSARKLDTSEPSVTTRQLSLHRQYTWSHKDSSAAEDEVWVGGFLFLTILKYRVTRQCPWFERVDTHQSAGQHRRCKQETSWHLFDLSSLRAGRGKNVKYLFATWNVGLRSTEWISHTGAKRQLQGGSQQVSKFCCSGPDLAGPNT